MARRVAGHRRATYSVTVNSFLSTGGDNFGEFKNGTDRKDTSKTDLRAWSTTWRSSPPTSRWRSTAPSTPSA